MIDYIEYLLDWICEHPIKAVISALAIIYLTACAIDLFAPIATNRGSWWNIFYQIFKAICQ
jgi:hypothetical protein